MKTLAVSVIEFCENVHRETGKYPESVVLPPAVYVDFIESIGPTVQYDTPVETGGTFAVLACGTRVCIEKQIERETLRRAMEYLRKHGPGVLKLVRHDVGMGVNAWLDLLDYCEKDLMKANADKETR
jgi:hypothetical protein